MAYFYSFGMSFNDEKSALRVEELLKENILCFDNNQKLEKTIYISRKEDKTFVLQVYIEGFQAGGDKNLFFSTNFYCIRTLFYEFLILLSIDFDIAFFEFEAADYLLSDDIIEDINNFGIGIISTGDSNLSFMQQSTGQETLQNIDKKFYDGLIIHKSLLKRLKRDSSSFKTFKKNYYWLPIDDFDKTHHQ